MTFNRNKVTSLFDDQPFTTGINGRETSIAQVGKPLGSFFMYKFDGVDPQTGDAILRDLDGDGEITTADRMIVGNPHPNYFGGLTNTFTLQELRAEHVPAVQPGERRVQHDAHLRRRRRAARTTTSSRTCCVAGRSPATSPTCRA